MKQLLPALSLFALVAFTTSCSPSKDQMKEEFMKSCESGMATSLGSDPKMKDIVHNYCQCSGDKVVDKMTASEIKALEKMSSAEQQAKLMPIIQTCIDDMQKALMQDATNGAPAPAPETTPAP